jgi:hypothetical protein
MCWAAFCVIFSPNLSGHPGCDFTVIKSSQNLGYFFGPFPTMLTKVSNCPIGEISPNLVTLVAVGSQE